MLQWCSCMAICCTSVFVLKTSSVAMKYLTTYSIRFSRWKQSCNEVVGYSCWKQRVLQWGRYNCMSIVFLFACWEQRVLQWGSYNRMSIVFLFSCWKQRMLQWRSYSYMSGVFLFFGAKQPMLQWGSYNYMPTVFLFSCWKQWGLQRSILMSLFVSQRCFWTAKQHGYTHQLEVV